MTVTETIEGKICILELDGRFDINQVDMFNKIIRDALDRKFLQIVLDCNKMNFISSAGLRILILTQQTLSETNGSVVLFGLNANTKRIFEITGYKKLFTICDNRIDAIAYFGV